MGRICLALVFMIGCRTRTPGDFAGDWTLCLESGGEVVCGRARVAPNRGPALRFEAYYPLTFDLDLATVPSVVGPRTERCGSLLVDQQFGVGMDLGIGCENITEADGGNLTAWHLSVRGDTVTGEWHQSCFSGCSARGQLTLARHTGS